MGAGWGRGGDCAVQCVQLPDMSRGDGHGVEGDSNENDNHSGINPQILQACIPSPEVVSYLSTIDDALGTEICEKAISVESGTSHPVSGIPVVTAATAVGHLPSREGLGLGREMPGLEMNGLVRYSVQPSRWGNHSPGPFHCAEAEASCRRPAPSLGEPVPS